MRKKVKRKLIQKEREERGAGKNKYAHMVGKLGQKDLRKYGQRWDFVRIFVPDLNQKFPAVINSRGITPDREHYRGLASLYKKFSTWLS